MGRNGGGEQGELDITEDLTVVHLCAKCLLSLNITTCPPTTFEKARTAKCASGQSCEINSDLIFLRAIITRDQNPLSWLTAEWERDK